MFHLHGVTGRMFSGSIEQLRQAALAELLRAIVADPPLDLRG